MNCAQELESLVAASCASPVIAGTYGKVYLIPFDAIDKAQAMVSDNIIGNILLKSGQAVSFESFDSSTVGTTSLVSGTYVNTIQHDLTLRVFVRSEEAKRFVNALLNARVVAIIKNKEAGDPDAGDLGESQYEAYGWESGLKLTGITADTTVADGVVYELALGSDETSKEKSIPKSVWTGSMEDTEQMLESLV